MSGFATLAWVEGEPEHHGTEYLGGYTPQACAEDYGREVHQRTPRRDRPDEPPDIVVLVRDEDKEIHRFTVTAKLELVFHAEEA